MNDGLLDTAKRAAAEALSLEPAFDVIVIGAGAAGALAAERFAAGGRRVLVLDAGYKEPLWRAPFRRLTAEAVSRAANPDFLPFMSADLLYKGRKALRLLGRVRQPVQTECYAWERRPDSFVDDLDCPYVTPPDRPFTWIRARALNGRVGVPGHGRLYLRLGPDDLTLEDGSGARWPLAYEALAPWYEDVEDRLALFGAQEHIPCLPDSRIARPIQPTEAEAALIGLVRSRWPHARAMLGRFAPPADTLEAAARTGRLALRQGAVVRGIDIEGGAARGVHWFDQETGTERRASAPIVFLCASAFESVRILLMTQARQDAGSKPRFNTLGAYVMDHLLMKVEGVGGAVPSAEETKGQDGRCLYLPRFDARDTAATGPRRGFGVQIYQTPIGGGASFFTGVAQAEMAPRPDNRVSLHPSRVDRWGVPILHIDCGPSAAELDQAKDQSEALRALAELAGVTKINRLDTAPQTLGISCHESGGARMGEDPETSVLDPSNQCWDVRGLYVTDSASFPSQGCQNPTLTVMALTARACAHALARSDL